MINSSIIPTILRGLSMIAIASNFSLISLLTRIFIYNQNEFLLIRKANYQLLANLNQNLELQSELAKTMINLELGKQDLIEIQRLNFESKLKLQTILFLDSTRTIMPSIFNNTLTTIETGIFISNLTNNSRIQSTMGFSLFSFVLFSILLTTYKIFFSLFQKIGFFQFKKENRFI